MTWERFFLLAIIATPIMVTNWLLWVILPAPIAYVIATSVAAVLGFIGRRVHDEAEKDIAIRSGRWPI